MNPPSSHEPLADLDLLAFRYIAGELKPDEAADFESRLADDQAAREAVARTWEIAQTVSWIEAASSAPRSDRPLPSAPAPTVARSWLTAAGWMVTGSLACLLLLALTNLWRGHGGGLQVAQFSRKGATLRPGAASDSTASDAPGQLALVWSETRGAASDSEGALDQETMAVTDGSLSPESGNRLEDDGDEGSWQDPMHAPMDETPSWVLAAVAGADRNGSAVAPPTTPVAPTTPAGTNPGQER
ncbi:MAG: hypothetical protein U0935_09010 [Pirellulales bacterium]